LKSEKTKVVAIIPARGGSKGIPRKNIKLVGGLPLVARAILSCKQVAEIDQVWVSTDDEEIASVARSFGAQVITRPPEISGDTASSESALLHGLDVLAEAGQNPEVLVFVQTTSPFIDSSALREAVAMVTGQGYSSVFSAYETHAFLWQEGIEGATGVNHDLKYRPRRQDRQPHFLETGAFYVMDIPGFRASGHRFFGKVGIAKVPEGYALEIDTPDQLESAQRLAPFFQGIEIAKGAIRAVVMDFDGVHTNDLVTVTENGEEAVAVSRSDGMGIELLKKAGIPMVILSKDKNGVVLARAKKLGIEAFNALEDKVPALIKWCKEQGIELSDVAYIGNDINDIQCLELVGWPVVPSDCNPDIRHLAKIVLSRPGGKGAVREFADLILKSSQF
jgi:N-acylneuraminate cytidylyltransferase